MTRHFGLALIGILILVPVNAKAQDSLGALIFELNLNQGQIDQVRWFFHQFAQKQANLPTGVDVALQNRSSIRQ